MNEYVCVCLPPHFICTQLILENIIITAIYIIPLNFLGCKVLSIYSHIQNNMVCTNCVEWWKQGVHLDLSWFATTKCQSQFTKQQNDLFGAPSVLLCSTSFD